MNGIIYKATNKINGKEYVGITLKSLKERIANHLSKVKLEKRLVGFPAAIKKYGIENFNWTVLEECDSSLLSEKESFYIKKHKTHVSEGGYNITWGGESIFGGSGEYHFLNLMPMKKRKKWIKKHRSGKNNGMHGKGYLVSGKNHFSNKMSPEEKTNWKNKFKGENNYQRKMTKEKLIEKNWYNKLSKKEKLIFSKRMSGDNNPFKKAYLKNPEKYKNIYKNSSWKKGHNNKQLKIYVVIFSEYKKYKIYATEFSKKYKRIKILSHGIYSCALGYEIKYKGLKFEKYDELKHSNLEWYNYNNEY